MAIDPQRLEGLVASAHARLGAVERAGHDAVIACAPALRPALRRLLVGSLPEVAVLSYSEVTGAGVPIEAVGVVSDGAAIAS
ncbi:hypothetical protein GCM10025876_18380 [Demequina litorisediminis]|uniref:Flagellar biosynthesis protein FlhA n=1 Tax=Demequina litorisediminis TaxID=1849022 RepID=A0ABQ6ICU5_9MICO|nr:hypothetical protein GCM10025876_18380 [Demequina litorisediminis]